MGAVRGRERRREVSVRGVISYHDSWRWSLIQRGKEGAALLIEREGEAQGKLAGGMSSTPLPTARPPHQDDTRCTSENTNEGSFGSCYFLNIQFP